MGAQPHDRLNEGHSVSMLDQMRRRAAPILEAHYPGQAHPLTLVIKSVFNLTLIPVNDETLLIDIRWARLPYSRSQQQLRCFRGSMRGTVLPSRSCCLQPS